MIPKPFLVTLVGGLLVLPIALVLVLGVASLLGGMGDELGAVVLKRVALGLGIAWGLTGVCLVAALGIQSLEREQESGVRGQESERSPGIAFPGNQHPEDAEE